GLMSRWWRALPLISATGELAAGAATAAVPVSKKSDARVAPSINFLIISSPAEQRTAPQMDRSPADCNPGAKARLTGCDPRRGPGGGNAAASKTAGRAPPVGVVRGARAGGNWSAPILFF